MATGREDETVDGSSYAWIITKDYAPEPGAPEGTNLNAVGVVGPADAPDDLAARLRAGAGLRFRMKDDDGETYYDGRLVARDMGAPIAVKDAEGFSGPIVYGGPEELMAPLDDFGTPNAGAVTIYYFDSHGRMGAV